MTEAEWNSSADPDAMLEFLHSCNMTSARTLRLAACACCRRFWDSLTDVRSRQGVEIAERMADGLATSVEMMAALDAARSAWDRRRAEYHPSPTPASSEETIGRWTVAAVVGMLHASVGISSTTWALLRKAASDTGGLSQQCITLRDIFVPFSVRSLTLAPGLLRWHDGLVEQLARAAYEERLLPEGTLDTTRLVVLADALEEAGFVWSDFLAHLRGCGPHYRGCYDLDALLGKS